MNGNISTNLPATIGACPANGVSTAGKPKFGPLTQFPNPYNPPVPPLPNPLPPQTSKTYKNTTLAPGAYGNITLQGNVTLTGGTPGNPAVYTINSLALNDNANLMITGPVVINLAGVGQASVLSMTGGSFSNSTYIPGNFLINYGGTGSMKVTGGNNAFAVINAPNAAISFHGGSNFYGAAVGNTIDDLGGTTLLWDFVGYVPTNATAGEQQPFSRNQSPRTELLTTCLVASQTGFSGGRKSPPEAYFLSCKGRAHPQPACVASEGLRESRKRA